MYTQHDTRSHGKGLEAEKRFEALAKTHGYDVKESSDSMNINGHVDYILTDKCGQVMRVEVKSNKPYAIVEFQNVQGYLGWLYGKATHIAYERDSDFVIIPRDKLAEYAEKVVDFSKVTTTDKLIHHQLTRRAFSLEKVSSLSYSEILSFAVIWRK